MVSIFYKSSKIGTFIVTKPLLIPPPSSLKYAVNAKHVKNIRKHLVIFVTRKHSANIYGFSAILLFQISSNRMPKLSHINNAVQQVKPHVIGIKFPKRTPWTPQSKFEVITTNAEIGLHWEEVYF